jgi:glyoxylase-like metal-dependent hydrolase (beta-lactamase superfamily II)
MIDALYLLDTGYCRASESSLIQGGARRLIDCHALVALLHHTREGWLLFDTGYAPLLTEATALFPYLLYRWMFFAHAKPEQAVAAQLSRFGLTPADIQQVIVSHFHPDHASGLVDFPASRFVATRTAWNAVQGVTGMTALRRGFLPTLVPSDFASRAHLLDKPNGPELPELGATYDLFGDGSVLLVPLPGHAKGQIGLFAPDTPRGPVCLVTDAAYQTRSLRENRPPAPITHLFVDDGAAVAETVARLHRFHKQRPDVLLLPTHCPEAFARVAEWGAP